MIIILGIDKSVLSLYIIVEGRTIMPYKDKEKKKAYRKSYYQKNKEKEKAQMKAYDKAYRVANIDKINAYRVANRDRINAYIKDYRESHKEQIKEKSKDYYESHMDEIKDYNKAYMKKRLKNDPLFAFKYDVRKVTAKAFKRRGFRKNGRTEKLLGCTFEYLMKYLNPPKDFFTNRSKYHIDHIVPLETAKTEEAVIALCHYTNLQILTAEENMAKGSKY